MNSPSSAGPEKPATDGPCRPGRWRRFGRRCWRGFRWSVRLGYVALALLAYTLFHIHNVGVPGFLKDSILAQLSDLGLELDYSRLRVTYSRGLVAENVTLRFRGGRPDQFMYLKEVQLELDWRPLWTLSAPTVRALGLLSGEGVVPVEGAPGESSAVMRFSEITGELSFLTPEEWQLTRLTARMNNVQFEGMGSLTNVTRLRIQRGRSTGQLELKSPILARVALGLDQIEFQEPPHIELTFALDGASLSRSVVQMRFGTAGARSRYGDFDQVRLSVDVQPARDVDAWLHSVVELESAAVRTPWGSFESLQWRAEAVFPPTNEPPAWLRSNLKAKSLTHALGRLGEVSLEALTIQTNHPPRAVDLPAWTTAEITNTPGFTTRLDLVAADVSSKWASATNLQLTATLWNATNQWLPFTTDWELHSGHAQTTEARAESLWLRGFAQAVPPNQRPTLAPPWASLAPWNFHLATRATNVVARTGHRAERLAVEADWRAGHLELTNLALQVPAGSVAGNLDLEVISRKVDAQLRGAVELRGLEVYLGPNWWQQMTNSGVHADNRLAFDLSARGQLPPWETSLTNWPRELRPGLVVAGVLGATNFHWGAIHVTEVRAPFKLADTTLALDSFRLTQGDGVLTADFETDLATKTYHAKLQSSLDPLAFDSLIRAPGIRRQFDFVTFLDPPIVSAEAWGNWEQPQALGLRATVALTNATYRLEPVTELRTALSFTNRDLVFTGVELRQGTNEAHAALLRYDIPNRLLHITNAIARLSVDSIARIIGPRTAQTLAPYYFPQPPEVHLTGSIPIAEGALADVVFQVRAPEFEWWYFRFTNLLATVGWSGDALTITNVASGFYGGLVSAKIGVNIRNPQDAHFECDATFAEVDVTSFMADLTTTTNRLEGVLSGQVVIREGHGKRGVPWRGDGNAQIRDGLLWGLPLFGVLSPVFNSIAPGMGNARFNAGNAFFTITNNVVDFSRVELLSSAMRMDLRGTVSFDGDLDLILEAQPLRGVPVLGAVLDVVLAPFTKLLEYKVRGTLSRPEAELRNVPSFLLVPLQPFKTLRYIFGNPEHKPKTESP